MSESVQPSSGMLKRPWIRFKLRAILLLAAAITCALAIVLYGSHKQSAAVAAIQAAGGLVGYESLDPDDPWWRTVRPRYAPRVIDVEFVSPEFTDAALGDLQEHLENLPHLKTLWLRQCRITDDGLAHIAGVRSLQWVYLIRAPVSDAGLSHLEQLPDLRGISLFETKITAAGIEEFRLRHPHIHLH